MTQQEYEQKKRECWEEFRTHVICGTDNPKGFFERAFDRAYALGREKETITQEEIRKAAVEYAEENMWYPGETSYESDINDMTESFAYAFESGANFTLGKQDKDADTVISGWVARDEGRFLGLYSWQPKRSDVAWIGDSCMVLPINTFPDLTWDSDPIKVEIIIKRKKNG